MHRTQRLSSEPSTPCCTESSSGSNRREPVIEPTAELIIVLDVDANAAAHSAYFLQQTVLSVR